MYTNPPKKPIFFFTIIIGMIKQLMFWTYNAFRLPYNIIHKTEKKLMDPAYLKNNLKIMKIILILKLTGI